MGERTDQQSRRQGNQVEADLEEVLEHAARRSVVLTVSSDTLEGSETVIGILDALVRLLRVRPDPIERVDDPQVALGLVRALPRAVPDKLGLGLAPE